MTNKGRDDFEEMVKDWLDDNAPIDLIIGRTELFEGKWITYASDDQAEYCLTDDGFGSIALDYLSSK